MKIIIFILIFFLAISCFPVYRSPSIVSRASMNDKSIFKESPKIVVTLDGKYFLRYRHAEYTDHFYSRSIISDGKLIFSLEAMNSKIDYSDHIFYEEIINKDKIGLIKLERVYWKEPGGRLVRLKITAMTEKSGSIVKHNLKPGHN